MATTRRERQTSVAEARNSLGEVISRARYADEATVLTNRGRAAAVVVSYEFYERACDALGDQRELVAPES